MKFASEGVLFDKQMQTKSILFMRYVAVWLLRVATQTEFTPDKTIQCVSQCPSWFPADVGDIRLPLTSEQPEAFKCRPEYVLEDIVGNFNFIFR